MAIAQAPTTRTPPPAAPRRTLMLIDIENLVGSGHVTAAEVACVRDQIRRYAPGPTQAIVATSAGGTLVEAGLGWPGARLTWQRGADGADRALIDVATSEHIAERYTHVVIGSGDHAFAPIAATLRRRGVHVTVVTGAGRMSAALYLASDESRTIAANRGAFTTAA